MIEFSFVTKSFGDRHVLRGIDFALRPGEVACLIGRSGSGKSTILRCINGLETHDGGVISVDGDVVGDVRVDESQPSLLVISETATVIGAVYADHVIINGRVQGPVHARELLELQPRARIEGDIYYKALEMHQGAVVAGMLCPAVQMDEKPLLSLTANSH